MNPEEGDLRPQLIDRFGLSVEVTAEQAVAQRMEVIRRRLNYEQDPESFCKRWESEQSILRRRIQQAQKLLPQVTYSDRCLELVAKIAVSLGVDGHRADITMLKTAITNGAFSGRNAVCREDILMAAELALPHRMRRRPFEEGTADMDEIRQLAEDYGEI